MGVKNGTFHWVLCIKAIFCWCYNFVNLGGVKAVSKKVSDSEKKKGLCVTDYNLRNDSLVTKSSSFMQLCGAELSVSVVQILEAELPKPCLKIVI